MEGTEIMILCAPPAARPRHMWTLLLCVMLALWSPTAAQVTTTGGGSEQASYKLPTDLHDVSQKGNVAEV
jgi:hypothetical protein